jgi:hypothetical protein
VPSSGRKRWSPIPRWLRLGDRVELGGLELQLVGLADQITWYFGTPTVFVAIQDAQALGFNGQPLATTIITQGLPRSAPAGLQVLSDRDDCRHSKTSEGCDASCCSGAHL